MGQIPEAVSGRLADWYQLQAWGDSRRYHLPLYWVPIQLDWRSSSFHLRRVGPLV